MKAGMRAAVRAIMADVQAKVKALAERAERLADEATAQRFERDLRTVGQSLVAGMLQRLLQANLDQQPRENVCPQCGGWWHNKGRRKRGLLSSVGGIELQGTYRHCARCGYGRHAADRLAGGSISGPMQELLCLLGVALASFQKAAEVSESLLGVRVSGELIRTVSQQEGRRASRRAPSPPAVGTGADLTGSCDGTMVHTREEGWKELKAYLLRCDSGSHGAAYLETSRQFAPRLRDAAVSMQASRAGRLFWVSDAAEWIGRAVAVQLPTAVQIVDIWHAYQHIHEASRSIHGEGTPQAETWAETWCEQLRLQGARAVWNRLRRTRYRDVARQQALRGLLGFLDRHASRMDYPRYEREGWPISSGPMESFCKQLGRRLKGPGMRWSKANVDPMAKLASLWSTGQWTAYWS